jgi:hypothetical protein
MPIAHTDWMRLYPNRRAKFSVPAVGSYIHHVSMLLKWISVELLMQVPSPSPWRTSGVVWVFHKLLLGELLLVGSLELHVKILATSNFSLERQLMRIFLKSMHSYLLPPPYI